MEFTSLPFLLFFPTVALLCWVMPVRWRNAFLLLVSMAFYTMWKPSCLAFLLWIMVVSYGAGYVFEKPQHRSKVKLGLSIAVLLSALTFFKFLSPISRVVGAFIQSSGYAIRFDGLNWAIPVGLSTYTLQAIGYVVDVYRDRVPREHSWLNHALFLSFFPTVLSGPINRSFDLMPQIKERRFGFNAQLASQGARMLVWGYFLKLAVADRFDMYTLSVFDHVSEYNGFTLAFAMVCYLFQMYCDFAGYSFIAIGMGRLLGVKLKDNFNRPFFAMGAGEFWHRWHMALSGWLRDYVYIPLGGSRCSHARATLNTLFTFFISGIWHGGSFRFIAWGLCNGLLVAVSRFLPLKQWKAIVPIRIMFTLLTLLLLSFVWVFFQPNYAEILHQLTCNFMPLSIKLPHSLQARATLFYMALTFIIVMTRDGYEEFLNKKSTPRALSLTCYAMVVWLILMIGVFDSSQFIYVMF